MTLDDIRARFPHLGLAVYAYQPGGDVTLECHAPDGSIFKFTGRTEHEAVMAGFGEDLAPPDTAPADTPALPSIFD